MKNFWVQHESWMAAWHADVTPLLQDPKALLALVREVYAKGRESRLVLPAGLDPSLETERRWEIENTLDLFRMVRRVDVESELAWYDSHDRVAGGRVKDLGVLLATLQPNPDSILSYDREVGEPPVALTGEQLRYHGGNPQRANDFPVTFTLALHSDIWFPYVVGFAHPARDLSKFLDNRELAIRHTPRLNDLINTISRHVVGGGGRWSLEENDRASMYAPWLSVEGIRLEGPAPELLSSSLIDVEWPTIED